jgi:hypothetical protein
LLPYRTHSLWGTIKQVADTCLVTYPAEGKYGKVNGIQQLA